MWQRFQNVFEPWRTTPGWEFDLLRTLPPLVAKRLYRQAWRNAHAQLMGMWKWWAFLVPITGLIVCLSILSMGLIWLIAARLGLRALGRLVLDLAFHAALGAIILHPLLVRLQQRHVLPYVRTELIDELLWFAKEELAPPRQNLG